MCQNTSRAFWAKRVAQARVWHPMVSTSRLFSSHFPWVLVSPQTQRHFHWPDSGFLVKRGQNWTNSAMADSKRKELLFHHAILLETCRTFRSFTTTMSETGAFLVLGSDIKSFEAFCSWSGCHAVSFMQKHTCFFLFSRHWSFVLYYCDFPLIHTVFVLVRTP